MQVGFVYFNGAGNKGAKHSPNGDTAPENGGVHKEATLSVSLVEEGNRLVENLGLLGQPPHPATGSAAPINLYHKVGLV